VISSIFNIINDVLFLRNPSRNTEVPELQGVLGILLICT